MRKGTSKYKSEEEKYQAHLQRCAIYRKKPGVAERRLQWGRDWIKKNYLKHLLRIAKKRAKVKGIEFNITIDDVVVSDVCPIMGVRITEPGSWHGPSLDRRDNNLGYVPGNVFLVSKRGNTWKGHRTPDDLRLALRYMEGA